jgi:hypothetical protein
MAAGRKRKAEEALVMALACGASPENAARTCRVSERTVFRRLAEPAFQARVDNARADIARREADTLTAAGLSAIKTLMTLQESAVSEAVRLAAARNIIELGCKLREKVEVTERLAALEVCLATLLGGSDPPGDPSNPVS